MGPSLEPRFRGVAALLYAAGGQLKSCVTLLRQRNRFLDHNHVYPMPVAGPTVLRWGSVLD